MDKGKERVSEDGGHASQSGSEEEVVEEVQPQVTVAGTTGVKRWVVDLDLPPEERWSEVVAFHAPDLLAVAQHIRSELAQVRLLFFLDFWAFSLLFIHFRYIKKKKNKLTPSEMVSRWWGRRRRRSARRWWAPSWPVRRTPGWSSTAGSWPESPRPPVRAFPRPSSTPPTDRRRLV